jgi:hypothetical protein
MRTATLSEAVDDATVERIAAKLMADPRGERGGAGLLRALAPGWHSGRLAPEVRRTSARREGDRRRSAPVGDGEEQPDVGSQTACTASSNVEPIARCFDDNDFDAGASIDGEIIWSGRVRHRRQPIPPAGRRRALGPDPRPVLAAVLGHLPDGLLRHDRDGASETCVIPQWAALNANQSTGVSIFDQVGGNVDATWLDLHWDNHPKSGDHAAMGSSNSWWQFDLDWSCLPRRQYQLGAGQVLPRDYLYPWVTTAGCLWLACR